MEEGRIKTFKRLPKIIVSTIYPFVTGLEVPQKGQFLGKFKVDSTRLVMEDDGNEKKYVTLKLLEAEPLTDREIRV